MQRYIALLRGINVGGRNRLPMQELKSIFSNLGCERIQTYIQSGNVVFEVEEQAADLLAENVRQNIESAHGFSPRVLILDQSRFEAAADNNPFPEAETDPKTLHLYFLAEPVKDPDLSRLESLRKESERFSLIDRVFYLHAPEGIGRSKLAAAVEKGLGVDATARNWRTVSKVLDMTLKP